MSFTTQSYLSYRLKYQGKARSTEAMRDALMHVKLSIIRDRRTNKAYGIPSNMSEIAQEIYKVLGLKYSRVPLSMPSNY